MSELRDDVTADWLYSHDRPNTRAAYARDIAAYFAWCDAAGIDVFKATAKQLRRYRMDLEQARPGKPFAHATVHRRLTTASSWYRFACLDDRELVTVNPLANVRRPKVGSQSKTASLDAAELRRLFRTAEEAGPWESAFVKMLFYSSARISELCEASTSDMSTERGTRILWVTRKGGEPLQLVIAAPGADAMDAYLAGREGPLFLARRGGRLRRSEASHRLKGLARDAGITGKTISPHSLRHTYATLGRDAGVDIRDIQRAMGHAKLETTMRYEHSRLDVDRSPTHALARLLGDAV